MSDVYSFGVDVLNDGRRKDAVWKSDYDALAAELAAANAVIESLKKTDTVVADLAKEVEISNRMNERIRELEAALADWKRMRNEAMAVAISNRTRINELEGALREIAGTCLMNYEYEDGRWEKLEAVARKALGSEQETEGNHGS